MSVFAFDDLLLNCSENILKNGFDTQTIPPIIKGWVSEKIVSLLPAELITILLQNFLLNERNQVDFRQSLSMTTETAVDATKITLEILRSGNSKQLENGYSERKKNMEYNSPMGFTSPLGYNSPVDFLQGKSSTNIEPCSYGSTANRFIPNELIVDNYSVPTSEKMIFHEKSGFQGNEIREGFRIESETEEKITIKEEMDGNDSDSHANSTQAEFGSSEYVNNGNVSGINNTRESGLCMPPTIKRAKIALNITSSANSINPGSGSHQQNQFHIKKRSYKTDFAEKDAYDEIHECPLCTRTYTTSTGCKTHLKTHHREEYDKAINDCASFGLIDGRKKSLRGLPPQFSKIRCRVCSSVFGDLEKINKHQEEAHPEFYALKSAAKQAKRELLTCKVCLKSFSEKTSLNYHMYTHTGGHPFKCELCGAGFAYKKGLDRHVMGHTGKWEFTCEICGQGFRDMDKLMEVHCKKHHVEFYEKWKKEKANLKRVKDALQSVPPDMYKKD